MSGWTLVLLTAERAIATTFPLRAKLLCARRRFVAVSCCLLVAFCALDAYFFFMVHIINSMSCTSLQQYAPIVNVVWPYIDAFSANLVPFVLVLGGNVIIVVKLVSSQRMRALVATTGNTGKQVRMRPLLISSLIGSVEKSLNSGQGWKQSLLICSNSFRTTMMHS